MLSPDERREVLKHLIDIEPRDLTKRQIMQLYEFRETEVDLPNPLKKYTPLRTSAKRVKVKQTIITLPQNKIIELIRHGRSAESIAVEYRQPLGLLQKRINRLIKDGYLE